MRARAPVVATALLALFGYAAPTGAQSAADVSRDTIQLTLEDALSVARGTSPAYRQAVNSAGLNSSSMRTLWLTQLLPSASLTLFGTNYTGNVTRRAVDNFGNPIENPTASWTTFSSTSQGLSLNWSVRGASLFNAYDQQQVANRTRLLSEAQALSTLEIAVQREYWAVLEQQELLRAEEQLLAAAELDVEVSERLFRLASTSRVDVLQAELDVERQRQGLRAQEAQVERARLALRTRLGDDALPPFEAVETPLPILDPTDLDAADLVRRALASSPQMALARAQVESAQVALDSENNNWWPQLNLSYRVSRLAQTRQRDALFDLTWDEDLDQTFGISLSFPMFNNYFQNRQQMRSRAVDFENQTEAEREARLASEEQVRGALLSLGSQWDNLQIQERAAEIAAEALELAREEYRLGSRGFAELRQSIDDEATARRQVITARHAYSNALLDLEAAVGTTLRD